MKRTSKSTIRSGMALSTVERCSRASGVSNRRQRMNAKSIPVVLAPDFSPAQNRRGEPECKFDQRINYIHTLGNIVA
jgi:hypothetical protein